MRTFVYVEDKKNPQNFDGVSIGWVEDSGDGTLELLIEIQGYKITTLCTVTIGQSGNTLIDIGGDSNLVPCRLVTELFSAPEELEKGCGDSGDENDGGTGTGAIVPTAPKKGDE